MDDVTWCARKDDQWQRRRDGGLGDRHWTRPQLQCGRVEWLSVNISDDADLLFGETTGMTLVIADRG